jgi:sec-independent protein translocase protein TatA
MLSLPHLMLVLLIVLLVFGAGKLPRIMGDVGKGIRSLREGLKGDENKKIEDKNEDKSEH